MGTKISSHKFYKAEFMWIKKKSISWLSWKPPTVNLFSLYLNVQSQLQQALPFTLKQGYDNNGCFGNLVINIFSCLYTLKWWWKWVNYWCLLLIICTCHDIAEILLKLALNTNQSINWMKYRDITVLHRNQSNTGVYNLLQYWKVKEMKIYS